ncbi:putative RDD family membrane protein YckC [Streptomyces sp. LBL]|uniref:RDD family protein n=1 Tax=Streptomyces sp. LBL TaxID=2940562 RepID=UPI00247626E2|nr:RDD family protein [Streptomyces sp. LBL]MDH6626741.1 putative RDD family membrane protein YckC [Streptomyces sp. LBL]
MSAPTPAPGDDRPREGYYPDPSIPGYVRYWNGTAWVPGTSRPAPTDGAPLAPPSGDAPAHSPAGHAGPAGQAGHADPASPAVSVEATGPHFFDEDPVGEAGPSGPSGPSGPASSAAAPHGGLPAPAAAWGADRSHQSGFGGDQDRRVSWGAPQGAQPGGSQGVHPGGAPVVDPRVQGAAPRSTDGPSQPDGRSARTDGTATIPPAEPDDAGGGSTFVFRRPTPGPGGAASGTGTPGVPGPGGPPADEGTVTFRALSPRTPQQSGAAGAHQPSRPSTGIQGPGAAQATPGAAPGAFGAQFSGTGGTDPAGPGGPGGPGGSAGGPGGPGTPGAAGDPGNGTRSASPDAPGSLGFGAGAAAARAAAELPQAGAGAGTAAQAPSAVPAARTDSYGPQATPAPAPNVPHQPGGPQPADPHFSVPQPGPGGPGGPAPMASAPMASGPGGGQSSWAQQVHRLAGADEDQPPGSWKPPVDDIFQAAARRQASARPAGLGKRLAARLVDTVVLVGVTAVAAVPLGTKAIDHVNEKIDAAKLSGETVTVWLLDGTTSTYLGIVLAVLLLFGALYEALPTAKWGRTLGKKLFGLDVRDIEGHEPPSFGLALRRWLVYSVPGLLAVGVLGVLWCLFDRPWHQCWHDKAAHTFVAG